MSSSTPGSYTPPPPPPSGPIGTGGSGGGEIVYPTTPPKDPILVAVLNLIVAGGVGYIIIGQKTKGIVAIVVWLVGLVLCGIPSMIVALVGAIDGYLQAQQLQQGKPVGQWTFFNDHR
jgi:hypothetical protein